MDVAGKEYDVLDFVIDDRLKDLPSRNGKGWPGITRLLLPNPALVLETLPRVDRIGYEHARRHDELRDVASDGLRFNEPVQEPIELARLVVSVKAWPSQQVIVVE